MTTVKLPQLFVEDDYIKMCEKWKKDGDTQDPITYDDIPKEFLLRLRTSTNTNNSVLMCRDVRSLKELLERSRFEHKPLLDPITRVEYPTDVIKLIDDHPYSKNFNVTRFRQQLQGDSSEIINTQIHQDFQLATTLTPAQQNITTPSVIVHTLGAPVVSDGLFVLVDIVALSSYYDKNLYEECDIPAEIEQIQINLLQGVISQQDLDVKFDKAVSKYKRDNSIISYQYFNTAPGIFVKCDIALLINNMLQLKTALRQLLSRKVTLSREQWDKLDFYAWQTTNPFEFVNVIRSGRPALYGRLKYPKQILKPLIDEYMNT